MFMSFPLRNEIRVMTKKEAIEVINKYMNYETNRLTSTWDKLFFVTKYEITFGKQDDEYWAILKTGNYSISDQGKDLMSVLQIITALYIEEINEKKT